jgi:hypothetical protein
VDKTTLVSDDIEAGKRLVLELERAGLPIASAMWLRQAGERVWGLYISSPDVQTYGPLVVYRFIDDMINWSDIPLSLDDISAVNTTNHFVNNISMPVRLADEPRILHNSYDGTIHIEDAVIYKSTRKVKPSVKPPKFRKRKAA